MSEQLCTDLTYRSRYLHYLINSSQMEEIIWQKKASGHHKKASEHLTHAARHHGEAAKHHEAGSHEKAAHHAHVARGHVIHGREHAEEAVKLISKSTAKNSSSSRRVS